MAIIHTTCNMTTYPSRAGGICFPFQYLLVKWMLVYMKSLRRCSLCTSGRLEVKPPRF